MSSIAYNGHDFSEHVTAELVEPAGHALSPRTLAVPGRPGAALLGCELPPRALRVRLFLDAGVVLTAEERSAIRHEMYGWLVAPAGAELSLSGEPDLTWRDAVVTDVSDWDTLFEGGSCEVEFTCFDPVAYGDAHELGPVDDATAMALTVGGNYRTWPTFTLVAAAGSLVAVEDSASGARIELERTFTGGEEVLIDCSASKAWVDDEPADADVSLESDFFCLEPGMVSFLFEGCAEATLEYVERWL